MIKLKVKRVETANITRKIPDVQKTAKSTLVLCARRDSRPYVPAKDYRLRGSAESQSKPEQGLLIYGSASVPYAKPHYNAPGGWNYTTPGTGPKWFDKAKSKKLLQWIKETEIAVKKVV